MSMFAVLMGEVQDGNTDEPIGASVQAIRSQRKAAQLVMAELAEREINGEDLSIDALPTGNEIYLVAPGDDEDEDYGEIHWVLWIQEVEDAT